MSDLIGRQAAIDALEVKYMSFGIFREQRAAAQCIDVIKNLPSAQPEIVRCKDCKWWDFTSDNTMLPDWHRCRYYGTRMHTTYEDFCSRGERREEDG